MKLSFNVLMLVFSFHIQANEHSLGAHEHGSIKLGMAVENKLVEINVDGPSEAFLGFEYRPKTISEKKLFNDLEAKWNKNLDSMIAFDKHLNCKVMDISFIQVIDEKETKEAQALIKDLTKKEAGVHSDIEAKAKLKCDKNLTGSDVTISLKKVFKNIKKLTVEVISGEVKSIEITKPVQTFKL